MKRAAACTSATPDAPTIVESFPPRIGDNCRVLVLGTAPSVRSLETGEVYAHPQNVFWPLMGALYGAGRDLAYADRLMRLRASGVGIWDVLARCERSGSLDSRIVASSEVANDIAGLLDAHPTIVAVALNGSKAAEVFMRRIAPGIDARQRGPVDVLRLPSTSPAHAAMSRAVKLERWRELLRFAPAPC